MIIKSRNVWRNETFIPLCVEIREGIITGIYDWSHEADIDYGNLYILPGFIDIHTHGWNRCDCDYPTLESMGKMQKHMPYEGVTSFLTTTSTASCETNMHALSVLKEAIEAKMDGAEILGINMEGNYISHACRGAQDAYNIVKPNTAQFNAYMQASGGNIRTVCYAPECDDEEMTFIENAVKAGSRVSIGHSAASYEQARKAVEKGASGVTHTGNGMKPFHHRKPGLFGAALNSDELFAECIGDGQHVDFMTVQLIGRMKGKDKLVLVTDSTPLKDDPAYDHMCSGGAYRYSDGTLFGSALYVNKGVYNLLYEAKLPLVTAINAATINPAEYLGVANRKGTLDVNKDADIVVCDEKFVLKQVYCRGKEQL